MSPYLMVLYVLANVAIVFSPPVLPGYCSQLNRFIHLVKLHWKIQDCDQKSSSPYLSSSSFQN